MHSTHRPGGKDLRRFICIAAGDVTSDGYVSDGARSENLCAADHDSADHGAVDLNSPDSSVETFLSAGHVQVHELKVSMHHEGSKFTDERARDSRRVPDSFAH